MSTHELLGKIEKVSSALEKAGPLVVKLTEIARRFGIIEESLFLAMSNSGRDNNIAINKLQAAKLEIMATTNAFKQGSVGDIFLILHNLENAAQEFSNASSGIGEMWLPTILGRIKSFREALDKLLEKNEIQEAFAFTRKALQLEVLLQSEMAFVSAIRLQLSNLPSQIPAGSQAISLFFQPDSELADVLERLNSLKDIYSELCHLLNVSQVDHPLEVVKMEMGSPFWLVLFGSAPVVTVLGWAIKSAIVYLHRNFTVEGKIESIPKHGEALKSVLDIKKRLDKEGIDTSAMTPELEKAGAAIAGDLSRLLRGIASVEIDSETFSVGPEYTNRIIGERKQKLLESTSEKSGDDQGDGQRRRT